MKIVEENLGLLSNDEVLAVLKDREADKQPVVSRATPSEIQAYAALLQHCNGTFKDRQQLQAFIAALEPFHLTKWEVVQLINHRPALLVELFACIPDCDERLSEEAQAEVLQLVREHLG